MDGWLVSETVLKKVTKMTLSWHCPTISIRNLRLDSKKGLKLRTVIVKMTATTIQKEITLTAAKMMTQTAIALQAYMSWSKSANSSCA